MVRPQPALEDECRIGTNDHGNGSRAASRTSVAFGVDSDVGAHRERVPELCFVELIHDSFFKVFYKIQACLPSQELDSTQLAHLKRAAVPP